MQKITFDMTEDQSSILEEAIEIAKEKGGAQNEAEALAMIAEHFANAMKGVPTVHMRIS